MADRPENLLCNGRHPDQDFPSSEALYRLFLPTQMVEGQFVAAAFRVPDMSVYRSRFCTDHEAKFDRPDDGVLQFKVSEIPLVLKSGDDKEYEIKPVHNPVGPNDIYPENYAHAEIRAFEDGVHSESSWPRSVKKKFQLLMIRVSVEVLAAKKVTEVSD